MECSSVSSLMTNRPEATGIYPAFKGGHNHMVDRLHQLVAGPVFAGFPASGYNESCFCIISQYQFP